MYSVVTGGDGGRRGVRRFHLVYGDAAVLARTVDFDEAVEALAADVRLYVAEAAPRRTFIHSGVVGWHDKAILIPGRSRTGKTTLVAEMVRMGATYYSDEYAVVDERGRVHPYARPLQMRDNNTGKQKDCSVESLGGTQGTIALTAGTVILCRYRAGARWQPRRITAGQGVLGLLENTVSARRQPAAALRALRRLASEAVILKGLRGEAAETARSILTSVGD